MSHITITLKGVAAELVLGNYMPKDATIYNDWQEFYHYDDLLHESQLLSGHVQEIIITADGREVLRGSIPPDRFRPEKSVCPALQQSALYLRTECVENAVYTCEFDADNFTPDRLYFDTQDYDLLFKTGQAFITRIVYDGQSHTPEWQSATPVGNLCLLCRADRGYLVPVYDAIRKVANGGAQLK